MSTFHAVAVPRLYRMIADQIAGRIRAGDFVPGGRLPAERDLAEQLQVSRASIREALIALELQGYVEVRVGTGVFVAQLQENGAYAAPVEPATGAAPAMDAYGDIGPFDLLDARLLVEPECAALAAQHATPVQLAAIEASYQALSTTDTPGAHDRAFHSAIATGCGNAALAATVNHLWNMSQASSVFRRLQDYLVTGNAWEAAHAEHRRILGAIVERDPIRARHAMYNHLIGILARLREDFGSDSNLRPGTARAP